MLIILIILSSLLLMMIMMTYSKESFANQYSLLGREEPEWLNFSLTKRPRVSNSENPTYYWWKNDYWNNYDNKLKEAETKAYKEAETKAYKEPKSFRQLPCTSSLDKTYGYESRCNNCLLYSNPKEFCKLHPKYRKCPNNWIHE